MINKFKEKIIRHKEALEMVLEQGNTIEKKSNGKNPNWEQVYNIHIGKNRIIEQ